MRSIARAGTLVAGLLVAGATLAAPATAAPPTLTASASFGRPAYVSGQTVTATLRVHNSGSSAATGIHAAADTGPTEIDLDLATDNKLASPVTVPAGGTVTVTVTGHLGSTTATKATFSGFVFDAQGNGVANFGVSVPVAVRTTRLTGEVFGDANANGRADAGEGVNGVRLDLGYLYGSSRYVVTTTSGGRFSVVLPWASYYLSGAGNGWAVIAKVVDVSATTPALSLRAVRPNLRALRASLHFTKHVYAPGETVHLVVTLTNTGSSELRGITAGCNRAGDPDGLVANGTEWGSLAYDSSGVTIAPHSARTLYVTDRVPAGAARAGVVVASCDFGYPGLDTYYRPNAADSAKVPGEYGAFSVTVLHYPNGHANPGVGLAGVRVVIVDSTTCPLIRHTATTGSSGTARIGGLPAGPGYQVYLYPPTGWKITPPNPAPAFVYGHDTITFSEEAVRGTAAVPAVPTRCTAPASATTTPTAPSSSAGPILANTGTSSAAPAEVGAAALLGGVLLAGLGRRRRRAH